MEYRKNNLCLGLVVLILGAPSVFGAFYQTYDLGNSCGQNISVSCPTLTTGRAGTLRWSPPPSNNCTVNFTLDANCGGLFSSQYAVYFNIRKFDTPSAWNPDTVEIYENRYGYRTLVKRLSGYESASSGPASVAQVISLYSTRPSFSINYTRKSLETVLFHEVLIDYVILEGSSSSHNTYCSALNGYVNNNYICDNDYPNDRCNCPSSYTSDIGRNPAYLRRYCDTTFSGGMIAGVILGSIGFIMLFVLLGILARRRRLQHIIVARSCHHEPTVVGPYQPMPSYQTTPPPYQQPTQSYGSNKI